jgi:acyl dehydratase
MAYQAVPAIKETKTGLNYGFDRLRFIAPVPTGSRVRGRFRLANLEVKSDRWQTTMEVTVEIEGRDKPALAAQWIGAGLL